MLYSTNCPLSLVRILLSGFHHSRRLCSRKRFQSSAAMAPRKRKTPEAEGGSKPEKKPPTAGMTRSSARLAQTGQAPSLAIQPAPEKTKPPRKKAGKANKAQPKPKPEPAANGKGEELVEEKSEKGKTVVIEHCKQCNQFKIRALKVKDGLEKGISGITVLVNSGKPRRGCFEIREEGGETFISLLDMKRPFGPMKALDMDEVISDIVDKLSG